MKLRYSARARLQLLTIEEYIRKDNPAAAARVGEHIREAAELLRHFPYGGRTGRSPGTREWVVRRLPYILVYEVNVEDDEIMILGIFHGAQRR
jgi:toxin ParE1/3/4